MIENYYLCQNCMNRRVRVYMASGDIYDGTVVNVDDQYVYLQQGDAFISSKPVRTKAFVNPIITLVLFDLLAIALLI